MNPKEKALLEIIEHLKKSMENVSREIRKNRQQLGHLAFNQSVLKRKKAELHRLINAIEYAKKPCNIAMTQKKEELQEYLDNQKITRDPPLLA